MGKSKKLPTVLTSQEAQQLLAQPNRKCPTGLRNYLLMLVMYRAGLRYSEALNLKARDIDWQEGLLKVVDGKGGKDRVVPLESAVHSLLDAYRASQGIKGASLLFSTLKGDQLNDRYVRRMVKRYGSKAGIAKDIHPHTLRHSFATDLLNDGLHIREVQELLGHENLATTLVYTHVNPTHLAKKIRSRPSLNIG